MLNYFNFKKFGNEYLLTNDLGKFTFVSEHNFKELIKTNKVETVELLNELENKYFIYNISEMSFAEQLIGQIRNEKSHLLKSTQLHIFVVTNVCNLRCVYCQAQDGSKQTNGFMTKEIAKKSVDIAFQSPARDLSFEFQGGEPLLNFEIIKYIVEYTESIKCNRIINYSIVTNLTLMTDEIIAFVKSYNINISTSIDGDNQVHNVNRPYINGNKTFNKVKLMVERLREENIEIGAIQTTTKFSLNKYKEIVDTYISLGFKSVFIRPLTPLGLATSSWNEIGYTADEFVEFYKNIIDYILQINNSDVRITESYTSIFLNRILSDMSQNYMELRSPCGASVGQIAYYYNGNIYTCDEGRMVAEMGNDSFLLGNVYKDNYNTLMDCSKCKMVCSASILESLPSCSDCVYQPFCGVCPVVNYSTYKDIYEKEPNGFKCKINKQILDYIFLRIKLNNIKSVDEFWGV